MDNTTTVMPSDLIKAINSLSEDKNDRDDQQSQLFRAVFVDISRHFPNHVLEDLSYLLRRRAQEGIEFYLEELPKLGKAFEASLITGEKLKLPNGWKNLSGSGLPKFLGELFSQLFDTNGTPLFDHRRKSGWSDRGRFACQYIRQVCLMWSKVRCDHSSTKVDDEAKMGFIARVTEQKAVRFDSSLTRDALREAHWLLRNVFSHRSETLDNLRSFRKRPWGYHSSGAVAGHESPCEKWSFERWPGLPEELFLWSGDDRVNSVLVPSQPASRIVTVPKDFRGPRVICVEPKENQFGQHGLWFLLEKHLRECELTRKSINFQSVARSRSLCYNYDLATIDLKDASDHLSLALCRLILPKWMFRLLTVFRTRKLVYKKDEFSVEETESLVFPIDTRKHESLKAERSSFYRAFATMGSAVCFPVQTVVFWALSLGTMLSVRNSFPKRQQTHLPVRLQVFGDDIIVPLWACDAVCQVLEDCGLVVNKPKTCMFSPVRESCGEWVFMGKNIPIYRFKTTSVSSDRSWISWAGQLKDLANSVNLPSMTSKIACIVARHTSTFKLRWNRLLQRYELLAPKIVLKGRRTQLTGVAGLYAWHVGNDRTPFLKGARERVKRGWQDYNEVIPIALRNSCALCVPTSVNGRGSDEPNRGMSGCIEDNS